MGRGTSYQVAAGPLSPQGKGTARDFWAANPQGPTVLSDIHCPPVLLNPDPALASPGSIFKIFVLGGPKEMSIQEFWRETQKSMYVVKVSLILPMYFSRIICLVWYLDISHHLEL